MTLDNHTLDESGISAVLDLIDDGTGLTASDFEALSFRVARAVVERDADELEAAAPVLRRALGVVQARSGEESVEAARIATYLSIVTWALDRMAPVASPAIEPNSRLHSFVAAVARVPGTSSSQLQADLKLDAPTISRIGRRATELGLAQKRSLGRVRQWELTPRGRQTLTILEAAASLNGDSDAAEEEAARQLVATVAAVGRPSAKLIQTSLRQFISSHARAREFTKHDVSAFKEEVLRRAVLMNQRLATVLLSASGEELPQPVDQDDLVFGEDITEIRLTKGRPREVPAVPGVEGMVGTVKWHSEKGYSLIERANGGGLLLETASMPTSARESLIEGKLVELKVPEESKTQLVKVNPSLAIGAAPRKKRRQPA
jgi:DNA-binding MarR family transcriptional regulator